MFFQYRKQNHSQILLLYYSIKSNCMQSLHFIHSNQGKYTGHSRSPNPQ